MNLDMSMLSGFRIVYTFYPLNEGLRCIRLFFSRLYFLCF